MRFGFTIIVNMILINLLPHREFARAHRHRQFLKTVTMSGVVGLLIGVLVLVIVDQWQAFQQQSNQTLASENDRLQVQVQGVGALKNEIKNLKARQQAVLGLQVRRNDSVVLFNDLSRLTPVGLYLSEVKDSSEGVHIKGLTYSNEKISDLLRHLEQSASGLRAPELLEIKATTEISAGSRIQRNNRPRILEFSMVAATTLAPAASSAKPIKAP